MRLTWLHGEGGSRLRIEAPGEELPGLAALTVRIADVPAGDDAPALPPMAGAFEVSGGGLDFAPRYPFVAGAQYLVASGGRPLGSLRYPIAPATPDAYVVAVHPTVEIVPQNLLRCYITFSARMSEGWSRRCVTLSDADGNELEGAFLPMEPELWDPGRRRLTMLLDPGRIKRGVASHGESGYAFSEGEDVELHVHEGFRAANGQPLRAAARRRFRVGPAVRSRVQPARWRLEPPTALDAPVVVSFERALDRPLIARCLSVYCADSEEPLRGAPVVSDGDEAWSFTPASGWRPGVHQLVVDPRLEDLAGNSVARVFDRDLSLRGDNPVDVASVSLAFEVRDQFDGSVDSRRGDAR